MTRDGFDKIERMQMEVGEGMQKKNDKDDKHATRMEGPLPLYVLSPYVSHLGRRSAAFISE